MGDKMFSSVKILDAKQIQCRAKWCGNKLVDRSDLTFFTFPENKKLADIWARNSKISYYYHGSTLCSEHFENKYFDDKHGEKTVFKEDIDPIPTIFNFDNKTDQIEDDSHLSNACNTDLRSVTPQTDNISSSEFLHCRLCARLLAAKTLLPIYGENKYSELLEICVPGKVLETDELSHQVCSSCVIKLEYCCTIIQTFIEADKKLRDIQTELNEINKPSAFHQTDIAEPIETIDITNDEEKLKIEFKCIICYSVFDNREEMIVHAFHSHPETRERKIISNIFKTKVADSNQIQPNLNNPKKFQCIMCSAIFHSTQAVIAHTKDKHKFLSGQKVISKIIPEENPTRFMNKYMCVSCPVTFDNKKDIMEHALFKHPQNKIISKTILVEKNQPQNITNYFSSRSRFQIKFGPTNNTIQRQRRVQPVATETFHVKYQCRACSIVFNTFNEVIDHCKNLHPTLKDSGPVANVIKQNSNNNKIICVDDDTIVEIDPNMRFEVQKKIVPIIQKRFKCLKCSLLFRTKQKLIQHALTLHPTPGLNEINCKEVQVKKKNVQYVGKRERYECLICCSIHTRKRALAKHTRDFHPSIGSNKFLCRLLNSQNVQFKECLRCNILFRNLNFYQQHIRKHISYYCERCTITCNTLLDLKNHLKIHKTKTEREIKTFKCTVCEKNFTENSLLRTHEKIHKVPKDVSCEKCKKRFTSEFMLKRHENIHTTSLCEICGKTFQNKYLRLHLQSHNTGTPFKCKLCDRTFKTYRASFSHQQFHFPSRRVKMCQICGKLINRGSFHLHMRIHTGERPEKCDICGATFNRRDHLRVHRKAHSNSQNYECPICKTLLYGRHAYRIHLKVVHNEATPKVLKNLKCVICHKEYKQKMNLEAHYRMHAGQRIYSCDTCDKTFTSKIVLIQHKKTHIDYDKLPFSCDICDKKFGRSVNLRDHRRVHTGEKPFPCPVCHRPFRVRGEMVKHMRIHKRNKKCSPKLLNKNDDSSSSQDTIIFDENGLPSLD